MSVKFCPLASSSKGNCIFIGTDATNILVDVGVSGRKIIESLDGLGIGGDQIDAIFITHEHTDHIQGVGVLSRKFNIPVYATEKTWLFLERHNKIGKILEKNIRYVYKGEKIFVNDICVEAFEIPHDAMDPVGYSILSEDKKIIVATDFGHITDTIRENMKDCNLVLLESNHDVDMLQNGRYPDYLKRRILGKFGHLSNAFAAQLLLDINCENLEHVYLGHLSDENNTPLTALSTVRSYLEINDIEIGKDFNLYLACKESSSDLVIL